MDVVTPLVNILSAMVGYIFPRVDKIVNLDQSIISLEAALVELTEARDDLKKQVDRAELLGLTCTNQVKGWLERVENVETEVRSITQDVEDESNKCCSTPKNYYSRYKLSRKVFQSLWTVNDLRGKAILDVNIADGLLLVPVVEIPSRPAIGLELMLEKVQQLLQKENVGIIGIYGIGGIGKTTLLKSINNGFLTSDHEFDVVIWAVVSKDFVVEKIQQAIGVRLGLSWDENQFQEQRVSRIYSVMRRRKFLLLLDDVWEGLDFEKIGIPLPNKENGCKVIFTTRSMDVCSDMDADHKLKVEFLNEKESWQLFREKVGCQILDSSLILTCAETIVRKCGGLPLALVTTGRAMANKQTEEEWKYAIQVLNMSPSELRGMEDVFSLLKFSYDNLGNDTLRLCFLYCSLFPEDYAIEKEQLVEYWAGEGFLGSISDDNYHIMGHAIIGSLKTACFLETGEEETQVKMHDVVRSFALWVASDDGKNSSKFLMQASAGLIEAPGAEKWKEAQRISLLDNEISELSENPVCPHLSTLLLQWNSGLSKISQDFFQFMPNLKVLDLSLTSLREIPKSIGKLAELQHLDLSGTKLSTLPRELGNLAKLRHLDLQRNRYLKSIPQTAISGLSQLRVLNIYYSFGDWELQHLENEDEARLSDLESLRYLTSLGITLANLSALEWLSGSRTLRKCVEYLYIRECEGLYNLQLSHRTGDGERLRRLSINNCSDFKYLAIIDGAEDNWLPNLEVLAMHGLPNLISVWRNPLSKGCLRNLRSINIWYCDKLKDVSWILQLPKLEMIYLFYCGEMEEVIRGDQVEDEDYINAFPQLRIMSLRRLPKLRSISQEKMSFPSLKKIAVIDCPKLKKLPLKTHNVAELPTIYCYKEWWDAVEWDDAATRSTFLPHFTSA